MCDITIPTLTRARLGGRGEGREGRRAGITFGGKYEFQKAVHPPQHLTFGQLLVIGKTDFVGDFLRGQLLFRLADLEGW